MSIKEIEWKYHKWMQNKTKHEPFIFILLTVFKIYTFSDISFYMNYFFLNKYIN